MVEELEAIADEIAGMLPMFVDGGPISGWILPTPESARFKALVIEAKSITDDALGFANEHAFGLKRVISNSWYGADNGPSKAIVEEGLAQVRAAARAIGRKKRAAPVSPETKTYVDSTRIGSLEAIRTSKWDLSRLTALCRELNLSAGARCHFATAMLLRTILNHVPPVLGFATFAEVANNYGGNKERSFKTSMLRLEGSLRAIADMHLHSVIRPSESVPSAVQVDFSAELDVLLAEVIRVAADQTAKR